MLKKTLLFLSVGALLNAATYKIFIQSFSDKNNPLLLKTQKQTAKLLENFSNTRVIVRPSGKYFAVVVEANHDKTTKEKLISTLANNGFKNITIKPASELAESDKINPKIDTFVDEDIK